jgi:hypothetical protein
MHHVGGRRRSRSSGQGLSCYMGHGAGAGSEELGRRCLAEVSQQLVPGSRRLELGAGLAVGCKLAASWLQLQLQLGPAGASCLLLAAAAAGAWMLAVLCSLWMLAGVGYYWVLGVGCARA